MPFVEADEFRLHYVLDGETTKPVVVLSNSLGADTSMWDAQMEALLEYFRVLRYDTRGHGRSSTPREVGKLESLGQDILTLLDTLSIEAAHVCGISLGGLTAMWLGIHAPARVHSLVLSNTAAKIGSTETWTERIGVVEAKGLAGIADAVVPRWFTPEFQQQRPDIVTTQKAMLLGCSAAGYLTASAALRDSDLRTHIHAIAVPTLVISGSRDPVTPPSDGQALKAAIPASVFHVVPGAHLCNIEQPVEYNRILLTFLRAQAFEN